MLDWLGDRIEPIVWGITVLLIVGCGWIAYQEEKSWTRFRVAHNCQLVGHQDSQVLPVVTDGKVGTVAIPEKNIWKCDDGVLYTR